MLFVRDAFPRTKIVNYCEFYFNSEGQDLGFDPEFPERDSVRYSVRTQNMTQSQSLLAGDVGISPTRWQKGRYPAAFRSQIDVVFDGVDCDVVRPDARAMLTLPSGQFLSAERDEVITFVNRNLEPHRGFHVFMRALPEIQRRRPNAHVVIVGSDGTSYTQPCPDGTYRQRCSAEIDGRVNWERIHFLGRVPYRQYLSLLQVSTVHVYLTYPFVLSWSLMEAMAASCIVVGSRTAPVQEVLVDEENGLLVDFFDQGELTAAIERACLDGNDIREMRTKARRTIVEHYDLKSVCLQHQKRLLMW